MYIIIRNIEIAGLSFSSYARVLVSSYRGMSSVSDRGTSDISLEKLPSAKG